MYTYANIRPQAPSTLYSVEVQGAKLLVDRCSFRTLPAGGVGGRCGASRAPEVEV